MSGSDVRQRQKAETRARLQDAGRALFLKNGYDATTVKDIAELAGVAVGSLFAHFESKADLLRSLYFEGPGSPIEQGLEAARGATGTARERLKNLLKELVLREQQVLELVCALRGAAWTWSPSAEASFRQSAEPLSRAVVSLLEEGQARGELRADLDMSAVYGVLVGCHSGNLRAARHGIIPLEELPARFAAQVDALFDGVAVRPRDDVRPD